VDLEIVVSNETESFLLASIAEQIEHNSYVEDMVLDSYSCELCLRQVDESNRPLQCSFAKKKKLLAVNQCDCPNVA
jgi:hypothetical protein